MRNYRVFITITFFMVAASSGAVAEKRSYGDKFVYDNTKVVQLPDFDMQFIGTRPGPLYPGSTSRHMGDCYEFRVWNAKSEQKICWSEGTGDIGPAVFEVGGKCLWLERVISTRYGSLRDTEVVVSHDPESPSTCERRRLARQQSNPPDSNPTGGLGDMK